MTTASDLKAEGNAHFKSGAFLKAAGAYSRAIKTDPESAILYSNRSASLLKLNKVAKALLDAETAIKLRPDWDKAYTRKGAAEEAAGDRQQALCSYEQALQLQCSNAEVQAKVKHLRQSLNLHDKEASSARGTAALSADLQQFLDRITSMTNSRVSAAGGSLSKLDHSVYFWPPSKKADKEQMTQIAVKHAFDSPEVLQDCLTFLRTSAKEQGASAAAAVIIQSKVAYPKVHKRPDWPLEDFTDGIFLQLDSIRSKQLLYFPYIEGLLREPLHLNLDFKLLEPLFR